VKGKPGEKKTAPTYTFVSTSLLRLRPILTSPFPPPPPLPPPKILRPKSVGKTANDIFEIQASAKIGIIFSHIRPQLKGAKNILLKTKFLDM